MRLTALIRHPFAQSIRSKLDYYSQFHPSSLTIQHFLDFARDGNSKTSYIFLKKELLVRLANIMQEIALLPHELVHTPSVKIVRDWYQTSFSELLTYETAPADESTGKKFTENLKAILKRHKHVVETMAEGVMELKQKQPEDSFLEKNLQYFLDRFYINRISIRMLINQHVILFGGQVPESPEFIGCIHPACDVENIIQDAFANAQFLCENYYTTAPKMKIECKNASKVKHGEETNQKVTLVYVPSHLYHIVFELIKNSLRAVVEYNESESSLPDINVTIVKGKEDLSIKISDRGGGVPRSVIDQLFNYLYTTAPIPSRDGGNQAPLAGYGYGLPLSRLYARYFQGDLFLVSMEGYGTDACLYLKALPVDASEMLPVFTAGCRRMYQTSLQASDWSQPPPNSQQSRNFTNSTHYR